MLERGIRIQAAGRAAGSGSIIVRGLRLFEGCVINWDQAKSVPLFIAEEWAKLRTQTAMNLSFACWALRRRTNGMFFLIPVTHVHNCRS